MPPSLTQHSDDVWNLHEFVDVANALLPAYLPKDASGRTADDVNPRLVRHYATLGLLPEPLKEGREARYRLVHLLHLLVVRKLLADGFSSSAIRQVIEGRSGDDLQQLLDGAVRVELVPEGAATADPRRAFLRDLRQKAGLDPADADVTMNEWRRDPSPSRSEPMGAEPARSEPARSEPARSLRSAASSVFKEVPWTRVEMLDGLELHVREDFKLPVNRLGDDQIAQLVKVVLLHLEQTRKGRS
jgi:DNA-binding transcriptional MerR regulator